MVRKVKLVFHANVALDKNNADRIYFKLFRMCGLKDFFYPDLCKSNKKNAEQRIVVKKHLLARINITFFLYYLENHAKFGLKLNLY